MKTFTISDLFWGDYNKKEYIKVIEILNSLTEEQKNAVDLFGGSRWEDGYDEGYQSGYEQNRYYE